MTVSANELVIGTQEESGVWLVEIIFEQNSIYMCAKSAKPSALLGMFGCKIFCDLN